MTADPFSDVAAKCELSWQMLDAATVRAKVAALDGDPNRLIWGVMLARKLERVAPLLVGLLPPEFLIPEGEDIPKPGVQAEKRTIKPAYLTPEQLARART